MDITTDHPIDVKRREFLIETASEDLRIHRVDDEVFEITDRGNGESVEEHGVGESLCRFREKAGR